MKSYWSDLAERRIARRRVLQIAGGATMAAAFLAACGGGHDRSRDAEGPRLLRQASDTSRSARRGGTLKHSIASDGNGFDPSTQNVAVAPALTMAYTVLLRYTPSILKRPTSEIGPDLAESWEFSPDRLQLTMKLRPGVKWHNKAPVNGRTLDVDDVLFSVDRSRRLGSSRMEIFTAANPQAPILSVTAPDPKTIVVKLQQPVYYAPALFATNDGGKINIVPKETDTTFDIRRDMIGTGPYVLASYETSVGYKFARNPDFYDKSAGYVDEVEMPIVPEYASAMAQFRRGNIYVYEKIRAEDVLPLKQDLPGINLYEIEPYGGVGAGSGSSLTTGFGWLPEGKSPFLDERVRQAYSLALDRELWLDTVYNVAKFKSAGLPVETRWNSSVRIDQDSWIDPRDANFGSNARYFQHDLTEARRLLAAAGYPDGLDVVTTVPSGTPYGADYARQVDITEGMARDAGFRTSIRQVDFTSVFLPKYRSNLGKYEGWTHRTAPGNINEAIMRMYTIYHSKAGESFLGFSANGKNDGAGDPYVDAQLDKALLEIDVNQRNAIALDLQRYLGKAQYDVKWPGGTTGFLPAWPAVRNYQVFKVLAGNSRPDLFYWWLDDSEQPLKKA